MTAEGKKEFRKKLAVTKVISTPCVISTHSNRSNVKKVFWEMTFINFIEAA